jgi:hypothetical protein
VDLDQSFWILIIGKDARTGEARQNIYHTRDLASVESPFINQIVVATNTFLSSAKLPVLQ